MAAGAVSKLIRGPGKLIVGPTDAFDGNTFPYGGTQVGLANGCVLVPSGIGKRIDNEGLGAPTDLLHPPNFWVFSCFLRSWDDDAVAQFFAGNRSAGSVTQHHVFTVPGTRTPGQSAVDSINIVLAFVPDNLIAMDGVVIYRGVPSWSEGAEIAFQRGAEYGIPLDILCFENSNSTAIRTGRMPDLALT